MPYLGFRLTDARVLQIGGFDWRHPGQAHRHDGLACTLDRIDLISAAATRSYAPSSPGRTVSLAPLAATRRKTRPSR
jgi:hypothetical protein